VVDPSFVFFAKRSSGGLAGKEHLQIGLIEAIQVEIGRPDDIDHLSRAASADDGSGDSGVL
jgi:hypothetical protein